MQNLNIFGQTVIDINICLWKTKMAARGEAKAF